MKRLARLVRTVKSSAGPVLASVRRFIGRLAFEDLIKALAINALALALVSREWVSLDTTFRITAIALAALALARWPDSEGPEGLVIRWEDAA